MNSFREYTCGWNVWFTAEDFHRNDEVFFPDDEWGEKFTISS